MNKVFITDKTIQFLGFELLNGKITISLLHSGIIIAPGTKKEQRSYYYECVLDEQKRTHDEILINILKERGFLYETQFLCVNEKYYIEMPRFYRR